MDRFRILEKRIRELHSSLGQSKLNCVSAAKIAGSIIAEHSKNYDTELLMDEAQKLFNRGETEEVSLDVCRKVIVYFLYFEEGICIDMVCKLMKDMKTQDIDMISYTHDDHRAH